MRINLALRRGKRERCRTLHRKALADKRLGDIVNSFKSFTPDIYQNSAKRHHLSLLLSGYEQHAMNHNSL